MALEGSKVPGGGRLVCSLTAHRVLSMLSRGPQRLILMWGLIHGDLTQKPWRERDGRTSHYENGTFGLASQ